jgi:hypothetical protein
VPGGAPRLRLPERGERGQHCEVYYVVNLAAMHIVKTIQNVGIRLAWYALVAATALANAGRQP